jgi:hypothetical protein
VWKSFFSYFLRLKSQYSIFFPHFAAKNCTRFDISPCQPSYATSNVCPDDFFFEQSEDGCYCTRGFPVSCDSPTCADGLHFQKKSVNGEDRCFCSEFTPAPPILHSHSGWFDNSFFDWSSINWFIYLRRQLAIKYKIDLFVFAEISIRDRVQFRACLHDNPLGPLRCISFMESLGYSFDLYANASLAPSGTTNSFDDDSTTTNTNHGVEAGHWQTVVDPCPTTSHMDNVCNAGYVFERQVISGKEQCLCRSERFALASCSTDASTACPDGFALEKRDEQNCYCVLQIRGVCMYN